jgi:anti-anti-sigma regulatory factor
MLRVHIDKVGEMAVVECEGRVVRSDAAFKLRNAVTSLLDTRIIVIDLSRVRVIEGGGLGMLTFLRRWAHDHDIQFKLFNPAKAVRDRLEAANSFPQSDFASLHEMMALLQRGGRQYSWAA